MDINKLVNSGVNPMPEEMRYLINAFIEGRVRSLAIVGETTGEDGTREWIRGYKLNIDDNKTDYFGFVGMVGIVHSMLQDDIIDAIYEQDEDNE